MIAKYFKEDLSFPCPQRKCQGALIAGLFASAAASVYGAASASASQASINATNDEHFHEAQFYNSWEAELARIWQHNENVESRNWQERQAVNQQDFTRSLIQSQRDYDSLPNQVKLAKQAGFNPSSVLSGGVSVGSGSSFGTPAIPSASSAQGSPSASSPQIPTLGNTGEFWQKGLSGIAQLISSLGQFDQSTAEGSKTRATTEGFVNLLASQVYGQQMENALKHVQFIVAKQTSLKSALQDLQNKYLDGMLKQYQGQLFDRQAFLTELQQFTEMAKAKLTDAEYQNVMNSVLSFSESFTKQMEVYDSQIRANDASSSASYAIGRHHNALADTEDALREFKVEYEKYHSLIEKSQHTVLNSTEMSRMEEIVNRSINSGIVIKQTEQQLRNAIKNNDWYEVGRIMNAVGVLAGVGIALKR